MTFKYTVDSIEINVSGTDNDKMNRIILNLFILMIQQRILVVTVETSTSKARDINVRTPVLLIL